MVLASTPKTSTIDEITTLADHIMDVLAPNIFTVAATQLSTDVDHLRAEIASLRVSFITIYSDYKEVTAIASTSTLP